MRIWIALAVPLGLLLSFAGGEGQGAVAPASLAAEKAAAAPLTSRIDAALAEHYAARRLTPGPAVDDLTLARRLWLDLLGTIPSLQELRKIEALPREGRRARLIDQALSDPRFNEQLAVRLSRIAVGHDARPDDLIYRQRRLIVWLTAQVARNRPWDQLVREMLTAEGLSTDTPAVNFTYSQASDPSKLAARSARAFLGVRIDCAQCHDHPFTRWKQSDFEGIAAWFARVDSDVSGIKERPAGELEFLLPVEGAQMLGGAMRTGKPADHPESKTESKSQAEWDEKAKDEQDEESAEGAAKPVRAKFGQPVRAHPKQHKDLPRRTVAPAVPFGHAYLPTDAASRRHAFAAWVTHRKNPYFAQAFVNRMFQWVMGQGLVEPLDALDTDKPRLPKLMTLLAEDFVAHGYDIRRTVRALVSSRLYRLTSAAPAGADEHEAVEAFTVAPLKPLRGDQLAAALFQASSFRTHDRTRALILRFARWAGMNEFTQRHADDLDRETPEEETLLQRLHLLNGRHVSEITKDGELFAPTTRLPLLSSSEAMAIEGAFLMTLTRRPTEEERTHFVTLLEEAQGEQGKRGEARTKVMTDLFWALINTTEFAWIR